MRQTIVTKVARAAIAAIACRRCPTVVSCDVASCRCAPCHILSCRVMCHIDLSVGEYHYCLCADLPSARHEQEFASFWFLLQGAPVFFVVCSGASISFCWRRALPKQTKNNETLYLARKTDETMSVSVFVCFFQQNTRKITGSAEYRDLPATRRFDATAHRERAHGDVHGHKGDAPRPQGVRHAKHTRAGYDRTL